MQIIVKSDPKKVSLVYKKLKNIKKLTILKQHGSSIIVNHDDLYESDTRKISALQKLIKTKTKATKVIPIPLKPSQRLLRKTKKTTKAKTPTKAKTTKIPQTNEKISDFTNTHLNKKMYFFLDIDRTVTWKNTRFIDSKVVKAFRRMKKLGHHIFFASGRPYNDIYDAIREANTDEHGIAENGGVIINATSHGDKTLGILDNCEDALEELQKTLPDLKEKAGPLRKSEIVLEKTPYSVKKIREVIKQKRLKIQVIPSPTSIHMSEAGIDKGTALNEFPKYIPINPYRTVSMGDSEIDIPLFQKSQYSMAVNNAPAKVQKATSLPPAQGSYFDGVVECFKMFDSRFNENF